MASFEAINFKNVNRLNYRINLLSGNLLPIAADSEFSIGWCVYSIITILSEVTYTVGLCIGMTVTPIEKALKDGTVATVVILELDFMITRLYRRRDLIKRIVRMMDDVLRNVDETMKDIVESSLKPVIMPFTIYGVVSVITVIVWTIQPITLAFSERSDFYYMDYNLPTAFAAEPFSGLILASTSTIMTIGGVYLFLKKFGVDVYMMHLVLLLTAQYRYTAVKLSELFQSGPKNHDDSGEKCFEFDRRAEIELKMLCRRQNIILHISLMLKELLSVNFSVIHVISVLRFCFIGVMLTTIPSLSFAEGMSVLLFACGSVLQFFLLCLSLQTLSDASAEITDKAFNAQWYQFGLSIKDIFLMLIMSNNLECKIAAVDKFNLSLPSFMTIMNQSYTIALLFLRVN